MSISLTSILVVGTFSVSIAAFSDRRLFERLLFDPFVIQARRQWYRFVSHALVHANWGHLIVNMFVLYFFGRNVEMLFGMITGRPATVPFLLLYLGGVVFSSLPSYRKHRLDPSYRAVGASGAVSAVLFAQVLMLPTRTITLLFLPIPMPAWLFGGLYLVYSWYMDKSGGDNVAHDAHFYGALYGVLFSAAMDPGLILDFGAFQRSLGI